MTALTQEKAVQSRNGDTYTDPVAGNAIIFKGALVALNASGNAIPAGSAGSLRTRGVAADRGADNQSEPAGALQIETKRGVFRFANSAGADEIDRTDVGEVVFVVDDQTVAKTDDTGSRIAAGTCRDIAENGDVWVEI